MNLRSILSLLILLGSVATAQDSKPLLKDFIGINGHFQFKPELYRPTAGLVRNYHNMNWDVAKPGDPITLPKCVNKVNWDSQVYGKWKQHGYEIDLCAQFGRFGEGNENYQELWQGKEAWMEKYGEALAKTFGPSGELKQVTSIEVGNEPGSDFDDALYQKLFVAMARGIRKGDPKMKIVTATARSGEADKYSKSLEETFSAKQMLPLFDVINVHTYALLPKQEGRSPWDRSYPEDPNIVYLKEVDDAIAWRDQHAPGKEVWVTEFGYDACTPQAMSKREGWFEKLNWQPVTDTQQAQYLVRSVFCFAQRDVERAYLYFFNDEDKPSVHASSGLTRHFKPKPAYWAMKHLQETLGDFRFDKVIRQEVGKIYVHQYRHRDEPKLAWVVWSPTGEGREAKVTLKQVPGRVTLAEQMPLADGNAPKADGKAVKDGIELTVSESPVYLILEPR